METEIQSQASKNVQELASQAEAFLFTEGEPMAKARLQKLLACTGTELSAALQTLSQRKEGTGMTLIQTDKEIALAVSPACAPRIRAENEREREREIGDAGLEVLAILLYRGPSTRSQIDYIRGVNTSTTLRTLLARGLALRAENPDDSREYLYRPTAELLAHLGVSAGTDLPEYGKIAAELAVFEKIKEQPDAQL